MVAAGTAVILGVSADIGLALAERLLADGWAVIGIARSSARLGPVIERDMFHYEPCDPADRGDVESLTNQLNAAGWRWRLFISCIGTMRPIGRFFDVEFETWEASVAINAIHQLRVLHSVWPLRQTGMIVDVMFMAGGGTNNPMTNYSAYCMSKIALIKICELLDDEEPHVSPFIIGPGYVQTRIHRETLDAGARAGAALQKTLDFMAQPGTQMDEIYEHLKWCMAAGKGVAGGRNFSTVHDPWRDGGDDLTRALQGDSDALRLRRRQPKAGI